MPDVFSQHEFTICPQDLFQRQMRLKSSQQAGQSMNASVLCGKLIAGNGQESSQISRS
jgi:hypothetical protein